MGVLFGLITFRWEQAIIINGQTCGSPHPQDGRPVDLRDTVVLGDSGLDDGVADDAPHPVVLVLLRGRVRDRKVGHRHANCPVLDGARLERTSGVDGHTDLEKEDEEN